MGAAALGKGSPDLHCRGWLGRRGEKVTAKAWHGKSGDERSELQQARQAVAAPKAKARVPAGAIGSHQCMRGSDLKSSRRLADVVLRGASRGRQGPCQIMIMLQSLA